MLRGALCQTLGLLAGACAFERDVAIATLVSGVVPPGVPLPGDSLAKFIGRANALGATLRAVGSEIDRIAVTGYITAEESAPLLEFWCVRDYSGVDMRAYYHPMVYEREATAQRRVWQHDIFNYARNGAKQPGRIQGRLDGAATYIKFVLWTLLEYRKVLYFDADVFVYTLPDAFVTNSSEYFVSTTEVAARGFDGMNTHAMLLTPSLEVFRQLLWRASEGRYVAYTNGEQDVLEAQFVWAGDGHIPDHHHINHGRTPQPKEIAKRIVESAPTAALECYRAQHSSDAAPAPSSTQQLRVIVLDHFTKIGFTRGDAIKCGGKPRLDFSQCRVALDPKIEIAWLPPPRENTDIPDFVPPTTYHPTRRLRGPVP